MAVTAHYGTTDQSTFGVRSSKARIQCLYVPVPSRLGLSVAIFNRALLACAMRYGTEVPIIVVLETIHSERFPDFHYGQKEIETLAKRWNWNVTADYTAAPAPAPVRTTYNARTYTAPAPRTPAPSGACDCDACVAP